MIRNPLILFRRARIWKNYIEQRLLELSDQSARLHVILGETNKALAELAQEQGRLAQAQDQFAQDQTRLARAQQQFAQEQDQLAARVATNERTVERLAELQSLMVFSLARQFEKKIIERRGTSGLASSHFSSDCQVLLARRATELVVMTIVPGEADASAFGWDEPIEIIRAVRSGALRNATIVSSARSKATGPAENGSWLISAILEAPAEALAWFEDRRPPVARPGESKAQCSSHQDSGRADYFTRLTTILQDLDHLDFRARSEGHGGGAEKSYPEPFDVPEMLPNFVPAEPRRRSAVFLHNSYYHFNCLANGLKQRGWDALTVSLEAADSPQKRFYHGEDVNLHDSDPGIMRKRVREFFRTVPERFGALHFYGMGLPSFFPSHFENTSDPQHIPWDFLELRRHGVIIGFMPSGCLDGAPQSSIRELTGGLCARCVWELRPDVCNDATSLAWNRKLALLCDWVGLECDLATPERVGAKTVYGPVVTTLDPDRWRPDLIVPESMRVDRQDGEVLVFHAVGNYETRRKLGRDIKGTGVTRSAIDRLRAEGLPLKLVFAYDVPSTEIRFLQVQADIIVDQLNYGRYGALAREAMMLGKPTICRLNPTQGGNQPPLRPIIEAPLVDANEKTIEAVLRGLVGDAERRSSLARASREFALAWHGQDACAARYEKVIDRIRAGLPPETPDLYPAPRAQSD